MAFLSSEPVVSHVQRRWPWGNDVQWSRRLGTSRTQFLRWRLHQQRMTLTSAENVADVLGVHPTALWGDEYLRACGVDDDELALSN